MISYKHLSGQHNQKSHGNRGTRPSHAFSIEGDMTGYSYGESYHTVVAKDRSGKVVGKLDYSVYDGVPKIMMVESFQEKSGVGTALVAHLSKEFGYKNIDWGMMTSDGVKLRDKLDKMYKIERVFERIDRGELVKRFGGKVLDEDGVRGIYAEFNSRKSARQYINAIRKLGVDIEGIDIQSDMGKVWIDAEVPDSMSYIRTLKHLQGQHPQLRHGRRSFVQSPIGTLEQKTGWGFGGAVGETDPLKKQDKLIEYYRYIKSGLETAKHNYGAYTRSGNAKYAKKELISIIKLSSSLVSMRAYAKKNNLDINAPTRKETRSAKIFASKARKNNNEVIRLRQMLTQVRANPQSPGRDKQISFLAERIRSSEVSRDINRQVPDEYNAKFGARYGMIR